MSYFDDNTGGDASDDEHKNNGSGSDMESDTETIDLMTNMEMRML